MHHLCWAINEGIRGKRKQIPCGRLLSEIFIQGKLLEIFRRNNLASDQALRTKTGKMINGKTLQNMKIIKKFSPSEKDLKESTAPTKLMKDFPPIYLERNLEVFAKLVADSVKESGISLNTEAPAAAEIPLQVRRKRTAFDAGSEASGAQTRSQGKTSLKHQLLTTALLLFPRGKEKEEKPLLLILKKSLQKLEKKELRG